VEHSDSEGEAVPKRAYINMDQESDAMSVAASDDEIRELLDHGHGSINDNNIDEPAIANEDNDALLQELETQLAGSEEKGSPIKQKLADIASARWGAKLDPDKLKTILDRHLQPENCTDVVVPRVNSEIWAQMSTSKKNDDLQSSRLQQSLQKSAFALLKVTDIILQYNANNSKANKPDIDPTVVKDCIDIIALLGHAAGDLTKMRRENIKSVFKHEFRSLCSDHTSMNSQLLFGNDLAQRVRDAKETSKLGNTLAVSKNTNVGQRYNRNARNYQNSQRQRYDNNAYQKNVGKSFLWRGSKQPRRQKASWSTSKAPQKPQ
jgi:hypothetical protein